MRAAISFDDRTVVVDDTSIFGVAVTGGIGPQGLRGEAGNGIAGTVLNPDYTLTINFTDGTSYTTESIRGLQGEKGNAGNAGKGIESVSLNPDFTLTIILSDGSSYTTGSIRGEKGDKGDTGNGIASVFLNSDHTLTIALTDGTSYTTASIRGEKGDKGDAGIGIPDGGSQGQVLTKKSSTDYDTEWQDASGGAVTDVTANGASLLDENGVAEIPLAGENVAGIVRPSGNFGTTVAGAGLIAIDPADFPIIKAGRNAFNPIVPITQHSSAFYGLAKAAGDETQSDSDNAIGDYTDSAKSSIQSMLGIDTAIEEVDFTDRIGKGTGTKALVTGDIGTNNASGNFSIANGADSIASGIFSLAEGRYSVASGTTSHAEGGFQYISLILNGEAGSLTYTYDRSLNSYRLNVLQHGYIIVRREVNNFNPNDYAKLVSIDNDSKTITVNKTLSADSDVVNQQYYLILTTYAGGSESHAEGSGSIATGSSSHSEGELTIASGAASHAEGSNTLASGLASRASGVQTEASGMVSVAQGLNSKAQGMLSYAEGEESIATHKAQHVFGGYNIFETISSEHPATQRGTYVEIVGNGSSNSRSNARTLDWSGNEWLAGTLKIGGTSYADATEVATKTDIANIAGTEVIVSGTTPTITAVANARYICGTLSTLDFTPSASGICDVVFTSGSTATVLTIPSTVKMPAWFNASSLEANTIYEINVMDGVYGVVMMWQA